MRKGNKTVLEFTSILKVLSMPCRVGHHQGSGVDLIRQTDARDWPNVQCVLHSHEGVMIEEGRNAF